MIAAIRLYGPGKTQSQSIVSRSANFHEAVGFIGDADHFLFRHGNGPAGNMADNVWLKPRDDLPPGYLADAGARDTAGMNPHFHAARVRPSHVAAGFPFGNRL